MDANHRIFDLPELTQLLARHLPQRSLFQCVQVSKSWHGTFIRHLWRTFTDEPNARLSRHFSGHVQAAAMTAEERRQADLAWYKDVFARHARYVRHLTFSKPLTLDGILEGAFEQRQPLPPPSPSSSGGESRSIITNLESLKINVTRQSLIAYFRVVFPRATRPSMAGVFVPNTTTLLYPEHDFSPDHENNGFDAGSIFTHHTATATTTTITTATPSPADDPYKPFIDACQRLILSNPHLRSLTCAFFPQILQGLASLNSQLGDGGPQLSSLKDLSIETTDGCIPALLPRGVTNLTLNYKGINNNAVDNPLRFDPGLTHAGLESLETNHIESGPRLRALLTQAPFLKNLSVYSSACVFYQGSNFGFGPDFSGFGRPAGATILGIAAHPPPPAPTIDRSSWPISCVTVLKCKQPPSSYSMAFILDGMLSCFPLLVEFHGYHDWFPTIAAQLCQECPVLEVIRIRQEGRGCCGSRAGVTSFAMGNGSLPMNSQKFPPRRLGDPVDDHVSRVLSTLSRLRVLDIPFGIIKAETMLEKAWVCLGLEVFRCQIVAVPFLNEEQEKRVHEIHGREAAIKNSGQQQHQFRTDEEEELMELSERSVSTRRSVMTQFSKLTSLKYLSLSQDLKIGKEIFDNHYSSGFHSGSSAASKLIYKSSRDGRTYIRYDDVLPDTLHLRLDSGLDQLASLTQLKYLGFESMDHRMGVEEVEWIAENLTRLKEVRGLAMDAYLGVEPDPENDRLVEVMRRLRPKVVLGQSFGGYGRSK